MLQVQESLVLQRGEQPNGSLSIFSNRAMANQFLVARLVRELIGRITSPLASRQKTVSL